MFGSTYTGDGTRKTFPVGLDFLKEEHLRVLVAGVLKVRGTDYTVQNATERDKAIISFAVAPANGEKVDVYNNVPINSLVKLNPTISHVGERQALMAVFDRLSDVVEKTFHVNQTDLLAGTAVTFVAPFDGYVEGFRVAVSKAITTGGTITAAVAGVNVTGAVATIANSDIVGKTVTAAPSAAQASYTKFRKGQRITLTPAGFATAGEVTGVLRLQPADLD